VFEGLKIADSLMKDLHKLKQKNLTRTITFAQSNLLTSNLTLNKL